MKEIERNTNPCHMENNKYTLDLINFWITNADTKINISCEISSLVIATIGLVAGNVLNKKAENSSLDGSVMIWFYIIIAISVGTFLTSLWFYFWALNPNLTSGKTKIHKPTYSIFYKDISAFSNVEEYIECVKKALDEDFNKEIMQEIYINSSICAKKMKRFKTGMWLSVVAIFSAVLASVLFYFAII